MKLSGQQRKQLQEALIEAFPTTVSIARMLDNELEQNLSEIAGEGSLGDIVYTLIKAAESQGWVGDLLRAGCASNPGNPRIKAIAEQILPNQLKEEETVISDFDKEIEEHLPSRYKPIIDKVSRSTKVSVYKAHDNYLERDVAIKVFHGDELELKENFKQSVKKAVHISNDPNFITIYDACFEDKYYYYTMEFIDGKTIRKLIDNKHVFTFKDICLIIVKIGNALIRNREMGFEYENIKPSNILLVKNDKNDEYEPFIAPFNLSEEQSRENFINNLKELQEHQEKKYREELAYFSPEQFKFILEKVERPKFEQSSQYSLGLLAYELFTYEIPNTFQDQKDLIKQEFKKLPPLRDKCSHCPQFIEEIILKMVSPEPKERYKDIKDAIELIRKHIDFHLNTAKDSYKRCAYQPDFDKTFFDIFYNKFIAQCPEAKKKFSTFEENEKEKEKEKEYWNRQHQLLKQAVLVLFAYFEEKEQLDSSNYYEQEEPNILSRIAEIHDRQHKNIPKSMYSAFVNALIETVIKFDPWCNRSRESDNKQRRILVKDAWEKVLKPGVEYMKTKYEASQSTQS